MADWSLKTRTVSQGGDLKYTVDFQGLEAQMKKLSILPEVADKHLVTAMKATVRIVAQNIIPLVPKGPTGNLSGSIDTEVRHLAPMAVDGKVGTNIKTIYPAVMEFGRKPGRKMPPPDAFGGGTEGYLIARAIAKKGTPAHRFMKRGLTKSYKAIHAEFEKALNHMVAEMVVKDGEHGAQ